MSAAHSTGPTGRFVDLSHVITDGLQTYPGLPAPQVFDHLDRAAAEAIYGEGVTFTIGMITMCSNTGTYIDVPYHRFADGHDLTGLALERVADVPAVCIDCRGMQSIAPGVLDGLDLAGCAVLFRTDHSRHFATPAYFHDHPHLSAGTALALIDAGVACAGIDSLNIDAVDGPAGAGRPVHTALLRQDIPIIEHLTGLDALPASGFRFTAVPPKIEGFGTFTVRAVRDVAVTAGPRVAIVGRGRMGRALADAMHLSDPPNGRGFAGDGFDVVVLAVPDREIEAAAAAVRPGPLVGHCSGLRGLDALSPHEAFGLHPLMTVTTGGASFDGVPAAIEGSTARALETARQLADSLGMAPFVIAGEDRAAYHAAAAIASNYMTTLEDAAETLMRTTGHGREILVPLVRASVDNWAALGGAAALTGPISRGDESTVDQQRAAIEQRCPQLLPLFDLLADYTRALARSRTRHV